MKKIAAILFLCLVTLLTVAYNPAPQGSFYELVIEGDYVEENKKDMKEIMCFRVETAAALHHIFQGFSFTSTKLFPHPVTGILVPPPNFPC